MLTPRWRGGVMEKPKLRGQRGGRRRIDQICEMRGGSGVCVGGAPCGTRQGGGICGSHQLLKLESDWGFGEFPLGR